MSDLSERLRERARSGPAHDQLDEEAADEIERLEHNQMSTEYVVVAQAAAIHAQEAEAQARYAKTLEGKCDQFTNALMTAMHLIDQLITENGRLCAASNTPPPLELFAAHRNFEARMKTLLGDKG